MRNFGQITPNYYGALTFNALFNQTALTLNGAANVVAGLINGSSTSGESYGLLIEAGTTSADYGFQVNNQANTASYFKIFGDGGVVVGAPTGGDQGVGTINATAIYVNGAAVTGGFTPVVKVKASGTTRNNTATLTNDPDLTYAIPVAGTYKIEVLAGVLTSSAGMSFNLNYSGTMSNSAYSAIISSGSLTAAANSSTVSTTVNNALNAFAAAAQATIILEAVIVASGTGTVAFAWAQQSAIAANLTLPAGSSMIVTRIA
jgi:hypothetical protein